MFIIIIYLIIGIDFLYPFCYRYLGLPQLPPSLVELSILGIFSITFIKIYFENRNFVNSDNKIRIYRYFILSFLVIAIISSILNYNNLYLVAKVFLDFSFVNLILFLTILELELKEKSQKNIIKTIYFLIFLQIPVSIYQYIFYNYPSADYNSGTISFAGKNDGTGILAILMTFLLSYFISKILIQGFTIKRLLLSILTFIPPIVGGSKLGIILLPITILLTVLSYFIFYGNFEIMKFFRVALFSILIISLALIAIIIIAPQTKFGKTYLNLDIVSSPDKIAKYESGDSKYGRVAGYNKLFDNAFKNKSNMFLGLGSDIIAESKFVDMSRPKYVFISRLEDSIRLLGTTGLIGLIMVISIIFLGIPTLKNYIKIESSEFMTTVACSFIPSTFLFICAIFYTSAWATQIGLSYWIILGILYQRYAILSQGYEKLSRYYFSFMHATENNATII
jgi:hypothetical protein